MKVLLANPSCKKHVGDTYEKYYIRSGSRWPHSGTKKKGTIPHYLPCPLSLAYSAAILSNNGFDVQVLDAVALDLSEGEFLERAAAIAPDLLFFEVTAPTVAYDLELIGSIKGAYRSVAIAIGGPHATVFGKDLLQTSSSLDHVLQGEYEVLLLELATTMREKGGVERGIWSRDSIGTDAKIEFDKFPFPAYHMLPCNERPDPAIYWDGFCQRYPAIQMQASRGCPNRCYFCLWNSVMYGYGKYRMIDPVRVVDQMVLLVETYGAKEIYFDDDSFTIDRFHVLAICQEIGRRCLCVKWSCMADVASLDKELLLVMSRAGCIGIKFGVESGSEKLLKGIGKQVDLEKVVQLVSWCRKLQIKTHATFALGLIGENADDMKQTVQFARGLCSDSLQVSIAVPFPGTPFSRFNQHQGLTANWERYDGKTGAVDVEGIEKLRKQAMVSWLLSTLLTPSRLMHHLQMLYKTLRGMGLRRFYQKFSATIIDELKNG